MKKTSLLAVTALLVSVVLGFYTFTKNKTTIKTTLPAITNDVRNTTYTLEGATARLENGKAVITNTEGTTTVQLFGEPVYADFNKDGVNDAALMLTKNDGGSGTFFYAVLAISKNGLYYPTNALLLGDRIAPQTITITDGRAVYNYAERKATDPMTTPPSIGKSLYINYDAQSGQIGELAQGFEGEADITKMNLTMKTWQWVKTDMNNGSTTVPKKANTFTLTFTTDGKVAIHTDCNQASGTYAKHAGKITFGPLMSTLMYCEGSQESDFIAKLTDVQSFIFTSKGELILEIKMDSGVMVFR